MDSPRALMVKANRFVFSMKATDEVYFVFRSAYKQCSVCLDAEETYVMGEQRHKFENL